MSSTWHSVLEHLEVKDVRDSDELYTNADLDQTPPEGRTWHQYNYVLIWFQSAFNVNEWNTGATIAQLGLKWSVAIAAAIIGNFIAMFACVAAARPGATYHVGYPTLIRSTFGIYGSRFFVFIRGSVALIWFGVQTYYGGQVFDVAMRCMFGHMWTDIPNHLPASSGTTTRQMLAFFLFWLLQFPLMFVHPRSIRHFFTAKSVLTPAATLGLFIFCIIKGHGPGSFQLGLVQVSGSTATGWAFMTAINSIFGTVSPMLVNQPDFARYAKKPHHTLWAQGAGFFVSKCIILVFGIVGTASIYRVYGEVYWNMWDLLNAILDHEWHAGARTGIWFVAVAFSVGTAGTNIFGNSIPAAVDLSGLLPKYFTIKRAQIFIGVLSWIIVPWKLLENGTKFITFLGSYGIFVGPLLGCMVSDYFLVRKGNLHVPSLYTKSKDGIYYFTKGWNVPAALSWACAVVLCIPGLYQVYHPTKLSSAAGEMYALGWLLTFTAALVFHYVTMTFIVKPAIYPAGHEDTSKKFEYMIETEGHFPGEGPFTTIVAYGSDSSISDAHSNEKAPVEPKVV